MQLAVTVCVGKAKRMPTYWPDWRNTPRTRYAKIYCRFSGAAGTVSGNHARGSTQK